MQSPPLGFDWGSWYGITFTVAVRITTIGGAAYLIVRAARSLHRWLRPPKPLVAFGHPQEDPFPFAMIIDADDSQAEIDRQERANEEIRLSSLSLSYLIENKDSRARAHVRVLLRADPRARPTRRRAQHEDPR